MALVRREVGDKLALLWRGVVPRDEIGIKLGEAAEVAPYQMIIVGSGTESKAIVQEIRERMPGIAVLVVDEKDTTMQARERYWIHNRRRGWRRFLPATMQVPPDPVDDYVALILAERVLL